MGESQPPVPQGSSGSFVPPLARGMWSTPFPPAPPPPSLFQRHSTNNSPTPTNPRPAPTLPYVLPPLPAPTPFAFPPLANAGPSVHPALLQTPPTGQFFGDPPTRKQATPGTVITPEEVVKRRNLLGIAVSKALGTRPLSARNLQNWMDGKSTTVVMDSALFLDKTSNVPDFLSGETRKAFITGCTRRLKDPADPQGTLRPAALTPGAQGPVRFLQYESGVNPLGIVKVADNDLYTAIGSFNVQSVIWAQATYAGRQGRFSKKDVFTVNILKWFVQIYDVYDWNGPGGFTPFPLTDEQVKDITALGPITGGATLNQMFGMNVLTVRDVWFRDLEVSGGGRAFLVRSEGFDAPSAATGSFNVEIDP